MKRNPTAIFHYALTVFVSSALLLVLEVVAGRLIAPYVGVSLYTWTAIIGVVLAGLSLGNWLGGIWADRGAGPTQVGVTLLLAALATLAIPLILTWIAPGIQQSEMSLLSSSLLLVLALFFLPAMLLGVITPVLTTMALGLSQRTGHIVGMMHALAAVGSIAGTFITGYWLVQTFGTRNVIITTAVLMILLALPLLRYRRLITLAGTGLLLLLLSLLSIYRDAFSDPCDTESQYFCIRVIEETWELPRGALRSLVLDHLLHGSNHQLDPRILTAPYVHLMDELVTEHFANSAPETLFFIGGGAYTLPRAVDRLYPDAQIIVAELDPAVTRTAQQSLFVDTSGMTIRHADARAVMNRYRGPLFDVVVADAFHDIAIPQHLITLEMARLVKQRLTPDGLYTLNIVDAFPDAMLLKSMINTLAQVFQNVSVWIEEIPDAVSRTTYVIAASDVDRLPEMLYSKRGIQRRWLDVTQPMMRTGTPPDRLPVLTDDYVPVERLMASLFLDKAGK